jgi:hypothetical protein
MTTFVSRWNCEFIGAAGFVWWGQAGDGRSVVEKALSLRPELVLLIFTCRN